MTEPKEPQSYADSHSSHREENAPAAESAEPDGRAGGDELPVQKVTDRNGGAKTDSYFKKRDYD